MLLSSNWGKCKFNQIRLENSTFSVWLKSVESNKFNAYFNLCMKMLK